MECLFHRNVSCELQKFVDTPDSCSGCFAALPGTVDTTLRCSTPAGSHVDGVYTLAATSQGGMMTPAAFQRCGIESASSAGGLQSCRARRTQLSCASWPQISQHCTSCEARSGLAVARHKHLTLLLWHSMPTSISMIMTPRLSQQNSRRPYQ